MARPTTSLLPPGGNGMIRRTGFRGIALRERNARERRLAAAREGLSCLVICLAMNTNASFRSIREEVSPEEWQTRVDLAACYRLVDRYGMTD